MFLWCSANHEFKAGRLLQLEDIALAKLSGKVVCLLGLEFTS